MKTHLPVVALVASALIGISAQAIATQASSIAAGVTRIRIANIDVVAERTGVKDVVVLRGAFPAGDLFNPPGKPVTAMLVAEMLDKGTVKHDKFALAKLLDAAGASIEFGADNYTTSFRARCLKQDLPLVLELLAEQLRFPAFSAEEFEKLRKQAIGAIQQNLERPDVRAIESFRQAVYPVGHPNRIPTGEEQIAGVQAAKLEDLKAFHAAHYGPAHMTLVVAGDFDPRRLRTEITKHFAGWRGGEALPTTLRSATGLLADGKEQTVFMPGKTSVTISLGQADGLKYRDADTLALRVATTILGSGFTGRLMHNVRDKEGLTYGIKADVSGDTFSDGEWKITATFAPTLLDKGIASTKRQLDEWYRHGVTAEELTQRQSQLVGSYYVSLSTTDGIADALFIAVQRGYDIHWLDEYPKAIQALTLEQVNGVIRKYLDPKKMTLVKAGSV